MYNAVLMSLCKLQAWLAKFTAEWSSLGADELFLEMSLSFLLILTPTEQDNNQTPAVITPSSLSSLVMVLIFVFL